MPNVLAGYPYMAYVDEGNYLWFARVLYGNGGWDPKDYRYPSLPLYAACIATSVFDAFHKVQEKPLIRESAAKPLLGEYDPLDPPEFLLAARLACLFASLATIGLAGWLAGRWLGSFGGWLVAALAALTPALIARGGIAIVDVWSSLFVCACLVAADRLWDHDCRRSVLVCCAGLLAGFAGASKYPAVLVALAPAVAILLTRRSWKDTVRQCLSLSAAVAVALCVAMPALLLRSSDVLKALNEQARLYSTLPWDHGYLYQALVRMESDLPFDRPELGWPIVLLGIVGLGLSATWLGIGARIIGPVVVAVALIGLQLRFGYQPFRNLLPLVPLLLIFVAATVTTLRRMVMNARGLEGLAGGMLIVALLPGAFSMARQRYRMVDSRVEARRWLEEHMNRADGVVVAKELRFLPQELARLPGKVTIAEAERAIDVARQGAARYLLLGLIQAGDRRPRTPWRIAARAGFRHSTTFGTDPCAIPGWTWAGNHVRIDVLSWPRTEGHAKSSTD